MTIPQKLLTGTLVLGFTGVATLCVLDPSVSDAPVPKESRPSPSKEDSLGPSPRRQAFAAAEALHAELSGEALQAALVDLVAKLSESDPAAAVELANSLHSDEQRLAAFHESLPVWLDADPIAARKWLSERLRTFSAEITAGLTRDVAAVDPRFGLALAGDLPPGLRGTALTNVFEAWTGREPITAANEALGLNNLSNRDVREVAETSDREVAVSHVVKIWAGSEPRQAAAWVASVTDPGVRRVALESLITTWAASNPAAAATTIRSLPKDEPLRGRLFDRVLVQWAASDAAGALDWVQKLPTAREREDSATTLLSEVVQSQPREAAEWALQIGRDPTSPLFEKVVAAWAARDSAGAVAWISSLPPSAGRDAQLNALNSANPNR